MRFVLLLTGLTAIAVLVTAACPDAADAQRSVGEGKIIDRRQQARGAFAATPEGIYRHYCSHCHGEDASGGGRLWASGLSPEPTDLTALEADESYLLAFIREGSAAQGTSNLCPPWERTISVPNQQRLARYLVTLQDEYTPPVYQQVESSGHERQPFPWVLAVLIVVELGVLLVLIRRRQEV